MTTPKRTGGTGRSIDADLSFWSAVAQRIVPRSTAMAEVRANWIVFLVTVLAAYSGWCVWDRFRGELPSTVTDVRVVNSPVTQGEMIDLRVNLVRHRVCERDFEWIVADSNGKRERFAEAHMHAIGNPGPDSFVQEFRLPGDMAPGPARLRIIWSWACPENLYETIYPVTLVLPEIDFEIAPRPEP